MKYMLSWEMRPEDMDVVIPLFKKMAELRGTKDYPKAIGSVYNFYGEMSGFTLYEVDDPKQMNNMYFHYHPYLKMSWKPLAETNDTVATYLNRKK